MSLPMTIPELAAAMKNLPMEEIFENQLTHELFEKQRIPIVAAALLPDKEQFEENLWGMAAACVCLGYFLGRDE